jgi:peroxiredoxin Q/BCP
MFRRLGLCQKCVAWVMCSAWLALVACKPTGDSAGAAASSEADANQDKPLAAGDPAPNVTFTLHDGKQLALASLKGQPVVVYFYPKDDTQGCTLEAEGIRDDYGAFEQAKVKIFGVSTQDADSHVAFIDKYKLPFDLVVDSGGKIAEAFRVPLNGGMAKRQTFLVGPSGTIKHVWLDVDPAQHSKELLAAIAQ